MSDFLGPTLLDVVGDELVHYLEYLLAAVADADVAFERFLAADAEVGVMEHIGRKCAGELLIGFPDCVFLNHQLSIGTFGEDASSEKFLDSRLVVERYLGVKRGWNRLGHAPSG